MSASFSVTRAAPPLFAVYRPGPVAIPDRTWLDPQGNPILDAQGNYLILQPST